jgi:hypothetical protein
LIAVDTARAGGSVALGAADGRVSQFDTANEHGGRVEAVCPAACLPSQRDLHVDCSLVFARRYAIVACRLVGFSG